MLDEGKDPIILMNTSPELQLQTQELPALIEYDQSIKERADLICMGITPNGDRPSENLGEVMRGETLSSHDLSVDEYRWAMAVSAYPYSQTEDKDTLLAAASDALYEAGSTYNPSEEPSFLSHFGHISRNLLSDVFGEASVSMAPSPVDFDDVVIENHIGPLPPLPHRRDLEEFSVGQRVFILRDEDLVSAVVKAITAHKHDETLGPPMPAEIAKDVQIKIDAMTAKGHDWNASFEHLPFNFTGGAGTSPDAETLRFLGLITVPGYPQMVRIKSPGFLELGVFDDDFSNRIVGVDISRSDLIPPLALSHIKNDPLYRKLWVESDASESKLADAFYRVTEGTSSAYIGPGRRARPKHMRTGKAPSTGSVLD